MIWLHSNTGEHRRLQIFLYVNILVVLLVFSFTGVFILKLLSIPQTVMFLQVPDYEKEIEIMINMTKEEYLASLRR